jgi:NADPH:quinone reductase-like Zn-dependent oxidoreductase
VTVVGVKDGVREETDPKPQRGEVLVRMRAISLNYRNIAIPLGRYACNAIPGLIPTSDAAGEIVEIGEGVKSFAVGDSVLGTFHPRWFGGEMPASMQTDSYGAENDGWLC